MNTNTRTVNGVTILQVVGKILFHKGDEKLRDDIAKLLQGGVTKILLDLTKVPFMDSGGCGELVAGYKRAFDKGFALKLLVRPKDKDHHVRFDIELMKLDQVIPMFTDEAEAVASFS